jgi:acetyltransferase-like isoleucine patch superfamily enzyme
MAYLSRDILESMGFARLGRNVKISEKASIYEPEKMEIGDHSRIDDFCVVSGRITMGRNVHIAPMCLVAGGAPGITLEDFSGLAYQAQVFAQSDDYSGATMTNPTVPSDYKSEIKQPIHLGRHCIVGAGAVIVPGVVVGEGTAIGALALLLDSAEPWSIYAGIPARRVKARRKDLLSLEQEYLRSESQGT